MCTYLGSLRKHITKGKVRDSSGSNMHSKCECLDGLDLRYTSPKTHQFAELVGAI